MTGRNNFFIWIFLLLSIPVSAQNKTELEAKRNKLQKQISETQGLINETKTSRKNTLSGYQTIQAQLERRNELISAIEAEVKFLEKGIDLLETAVVEKSEDITEIQERYKTTLRNAYRIKQTQHPLMYLLSAESMNQAVSRWNYLRQLDRFQKIQQLSIRTEQDSLRVLVADLNVQKDEKIDLRVIENNQRSDMESELKAQDAILEKLKKREKDLDRDLVKKKKESLQLNKEIERVIKAELARSKNNPSLPNAPELATLSAEFALNEGKLPWPVSKGIITGKFGEQPHPVLKSIKINNNGIDMSCALNAQVNAVFDGVVVGKMNIPGFNNMVIVQHGNYYTVYSKLVEVYVKKGDRLTTGQAIGRLTSDTDESIAELHFEVWKGKAQIDPERWLK